MPRVADRPRLIGWSSLHPCTSPISDVLRRRGRHRLAGFSTDGKLARRTPRGARLALTHSTETATTPDLADRRAQRSERLPSCLDRPSFRPAAEPRCLLVRKRSATHAPFSPRDGPPCASAPVRLFLGQRRAAGSPCGSPSVVTRDASDRLLPSPFFVRAPVPRRLPDGSRVVHACFSEGSPGSRQSDSLRRVARVAPFGAWATLGVVFPVVVRATSSASGTSVAPPGSVVTLARQLEPRRSPRPLLLRPREARYAAETA